MGFRRYAVGALLFVAACGGAADDEAAESRMGDTAAVAVDTTQAQVRTVGVMLHEWRIEMPDTIDAGQVRFDVMNHGTMVHGFEVEGQGMEEAVESIESGGTSQLLVTLQPGTYEVYCPVESEQGAHDELGMRKQLVVR